jgi:acyl-CoA synthetase (NDP forming)/GNAT superfamily N-acetyltransferase
MSAARRVIAPYPREQETDVVLRDGSTVHVRPVRAADKPALRTFLETLSPQSLGFRFFGVPDLDWVTAWSVDVDYADRFALIAETGTPREVISHAAYIRVDDERAEAAFVVADAWQGQGISTILLAHLAAVAEQHGITTLTAQVLPINRAMIDVFHASGFPVDLRSTCEAIEIELPTSLSPDARARFEERDRTSAIATVRHFLAPRSVAVVGASRRQGTIGGELLRNLIAGGFTGAVYPVNARAELVQSLPAHHSVTDVGAPIDLAVVVVPAEQVVAVARECATAGVRALLVISAGFAEVGEVGVRRQHELVEVCRGAGMRLVGPNSLGVLNTAPKVSLNATAVRHRAPSGRVGFLSQSGGLGIAIMETVSRAGVGLSSLVSVGNKADLSVNDVLQYWEQDSGTDVAALYLESFGNPRKFARVARRLARTKPIVVVKSGRSVASSRATGSRTGALVSASDVTVDALFHQAGVIRTDTLHELFDVVSLLTQQPIPGGDRIAIVTNAGGPGIVCADACRTNGVEVAELTVATQEKLRRFLHGSASLDNPIHMIASASADDYRRTLRALIGADACDVILAIFVPALITRASDVAIAIREVAESSEHCTIAAVFMTGEGPPPELSSDRVQVPGYDYPEDAARAVALAARYGRWRAAPEGTLSQPGSCRPVEAAAIISQELAAGSSWLSSARVAALLDCYGLPLATGLLAPDAGGAANVAVGPARVALTDGVELTVGVIHDPSFGPVLACGAGGPTAELIQDVAVRITPVTDLDAHEMVRSLKTFPLLDGYRGTPRCDVGAVEEVLLRVGAMVEAHPEIVELDCNPVLARPDGVLIAHARVRIEAAPARPPMPSMNA